MATKDISVCSFLTTADVSSQSFGLGGLRVQYPSPFNLSSDIPREKVTCSYRVMNVRRSYLRIRFNTSWTNHVRACGEV